MALVTLADARAQLGITDPSDTSHDTIIQEFIDASTELIEQQVGPITSRSVTETFDGGSQAVVLNYFPLISVDSVTEYNQGTANVLTEVTAPFSGDGYRTDLSLGRVVRWSGTYQTAFCAGWQNVVVTYHAGRSSTPPAIFEATLLLIQHMWETMQSGRTGGKSQMRGNAAQLANYVLPYRVLEAIRPYARPPRIA